MKTERFTILLKKVLIQNFYRKRKKEKIRKAYQTHIFQKKSNKIIESQNLCIKS